MVLRRRHLLHRYRDELERIEEELSAHQTQRVDRASDQWDAKVLSTLGDADAHAIVTVMEALARLDAGAYGRCVECERPIGAARLDVMPETSLCISCAKNAEHPIAQSA